MEFFKFFFDMEKYDHKLIEQKWQKRWREAGLYKTSEEEGKKKFFVLDMFPYPSGSGLHVGHVESYTATDIYSRYLRMRGYNVMHPQGWDAFGLPAENYAIKTGVHPSITTKQAIEAFKRQINSLGFSYDWEREVDSSDPEYYKWTQWMFLQLYKNGLAYKKKANANWCDSCQTVLANEQAEGGKCDRCGNTVAQKDLEQWFFKITDFIEDRVIKGKNIKGLIGGLDEVDWPESTKQIQKNWIGKSTGAQFKMKIKDTDLELEVFTTRVDTVFGMTYAVAAPEHPIIENLKSKIKNYTEVEECLNQTKQKTDLDRMEDKDKTGILLQGVEIINPFNGEAIPLFVADYVLFHYGAGAVMGVPAHDDRDYEFAKKNDLKILEVIKSQDGKSSIDKAAFTDDGVLINSGEFDGLTSEQAREEFANWLAENKKGEKKINYRLRDWLVSRQRYWGAPIPIIYCEQCGEVPVPEKDLPVILPTDADFKPTGESPLKYSKTFQAVDCPKCGAPARRESDTMDTFVCSSWYYLRYSDPKNENEFASREKLEKWLPVDIYVGGAEHSVLHLLYARFFTKALQKMGFLDFNEPFLKMRHQGAILAEDGTKMSKSKGNTVNPDDEVARWGADSVRMYEMFMGPLEDSKPWNTKGIVGIYRFLENICKLSSKQLYHCQGGDCQIEETGLPQILHKTIKKATEDIENFHFNTAISQMMIFVNFAGKFNKLPTGAFEIFLKILAPFAPHLAEELWSELGYQESIFKQTWPQYSPELIKDEKINLVVQINGKARETIEVDAEINEEDAKAVALASEKINKRLEGKEVAKCIFVKGKLINFVVR